MNQEKLESWAHRAVEELQDFVNEAEFAHGESDTGLLLSTQALIDEFDEINNAKSTRPPLRTLYPDFFSATEMLKLYEGMD